jgi:hypothetical protein
MRILKPLIAAALALLTWRQDASIAQAPTRLFGAHTNGGSFSTSRGFRLQASLGQIAPGSSARSVNYRLCAGFQCLTNAANRRVLLPIARQEVITEREPNGDFGSAQTLVTPAVVRGTLSDARDVFAITLAQTGTIALALDGASEPLDTRVQVQVYVSSLITSTYFTSEPPHRIRPYTVGPGTHYVIVYSEDVAGKPYALQIFRSASATP